MGVGGGRILNKRNRVGKNNWFSVVASQNYQQGPSSSTSLPSRFLQRQHPVHLIPLSAFLNCSKIAKYDTLRDTLDLGKQTSKNLKKAIAEADKALEQQKLKANAAESCTVPVEVINLN